MKVKVLNVIRMPREVSNGKYILYKIIIDKDIDGIIDGKLTKKNSFGITEYAAMCYNVNINNLVGKTIDIDITHHKAGDTYINPWGNKIKFNNDCIQVVINKVI